MLSELTRLKDDATRLLTLYELYKDSDYDYMRRKVHLDLDKFLMENRETAILLTVQGLQEAYNQELQKQQELLGHLSRKPWYKKLLGGIKYGKSNHQVDSKTINNVE